MILVIPVCGPSGDGVISLEVRILVGDSSISSTETRMSVPDLSSVWFVELSSEVSFDILETPDSSKLSRKELISLPMKLCSSGML